MLDFNGLKKLTVWLMLLGVLCVGVIPADAMARKYMEIDTEGDPGDGNELEGHGSGGSGSPVDQESSAETRVNAPLYSFEFIVTYVGGSPIYILTFHTLEPTK